MYCAYCVRLFAGMGLAAGAAEKLLAADAATPSEQVLIEASASVAERDLLPATVESVTLDDLAASVNLSNTEDALKYLPNIFVRKRHIGDTQAPMTTRTSGVGASARSLIYADGVLLSALIGNNNSFASPRWGMVAPGDIERVDVLYGPFAAQYPGNSIGAVVEIQTRMPEGFVAQARTQIVVQDFSHYATQAGYPAYALSAQIGDRLGKFAWRGSLNHIDSKSHPLAYVIATRPASPSAGGTPVTGAFDGRNRTGAAIAVLGAGGLEHQVQDNLTLKLAYDVMPDLTIAYTGGLFVNNDKAAAQTYLKDAAGNPVYSGSLNIGGYNYSAAAGAFANQMYRLDETHWMHSLALTSAAAGGWSWQLVGSLYDFAKNRQRMPSVALPTAFTGGAGTITDMSGTGWQTLDAKAAWRSGGAHRLSFGAHADRYVLSNERFNTTDWIMGPQGALALVAKGKTETLALWIQDAWQMAPAIRLAIGGRYENWRAYDGYNFSLAPALSAGQPERSASDFSPKASLLWQMTPQWSATASFGGAYRYPTVTELYQAITTGAVLTVPNPDLKPEHAHSAELAIERRMETGRVRLSLFTEDISDALISQSAPLLPGSTTLFNYVQNIDRVRSHGAELVAERDDVWISGLSLQGSLTYVDPRIVSDPVFPAAIGKRIPQVPAWRATLVATYRPDEQWAFSLAARYGARVYATIDNSDINTHTYQGFDGYFVVDARATYRIDDHWTFAFGVDNLNDRDYFLFHPFPRRSAVVELSYTY